MPNRSADDWWRDPKPGPLIPPPKPKPVANPAQYVLFAANDPLLALKAPSKYVVALSADPGYRQYATADTVKQLREQGHRVYAWCDCRKLGEGTPPEFAKQLVVDLGLDSWCGQAETADECGRALAAGAPMVVGNINVLTPIQRAAVRDGHLLLISEFYWNAMPWIVPDWQGLPVSASCVGMYDASTENASYGRFVPLADYKKAGYFKPGDGLFHVAGMRDEDWAAL